MKASRRAAVKKAYCELDAKQHVTMVDRQDRELQAIELIVPRRRVYEIADDTLTGVIAKAVGVFKKRNPCIGRFKATCHDGSTVDIRIRADQKQEAVCTLLSQKRKATR